MLHFLFIFFYSITLFLSYFMLSWRLQCQHWCQYFVWTLISFLISFSVTSFPFLFFYSTSTLFYITFIAVLTTAMVTLMPKIFPLCVYTCTVHRALTSSVYTVCTVQTTPEPLPETGVLTNQGFGKFERTQWQTQCRAFYY